ncbi:hypothetical protein NESM_000507300 [Novymonas esmeraldas]|uniref:Uncharacterized protein n=1 Tax=Novymonas esmeraldas TaxID=1808958 RepID=A0AAW0ENZ2_9TRYP
MTTDASPVNHYLLLQRADEFSTDAKIDYALRHHRIYGVRGNGGAAVAPTSLSAELERRMLVRTLDELKRGLAFGDRLLPSTPNTGTTFNTNVSAFSSPDCGTSPQFDGPNDGDASNAFIDGADDLDAKPWDTAASSHANHWKWPMEVLYQSYHLWIALDYGRDVFSITRNGVVLVDRAPAIVASLLQVVETTLHAREQDLQQLRAFVENTIADEQTRARVLQQVWNPSVCVSVVLLNVPPEVEKAVPLCRTSASGAESPYGDYHCHRPLQQPTTILYPPEHRRFTALETDSGEFSRCSVVTLLSRCDARTLLHDGTFMDRLRDLLCRYETVYRERCTPQEWPQSSLSASLEYLVRAMPERSPECNTVVFVSNVGTMVSSDTLTFLESTVRRKNVIVSIVALNRVVMFDSPELSPLARFLSSVGGFAVHVDYWLALAAHRLNNEWCRKFEGARCLAQQIFVQLINGFPVAIPGAGRRDLLADAASEPVVLYDGDHDLPDFVVGAATAELLRATAALRFNQGWGVLIDYRDEATPSHVAARYDHDFRRGTISLHYEMHINRPAVYRRLLVSGTKALVDHFCKTRWDAGTASSVLEGNGHWLAYLSLLRLQVDLWMSAEHALMQLVNAGPRQTPMSAVPELSRLSSSEGVLAQWFNCAAVTSVGVFFRLEQVSPSALVSHTRASGTSGAPTEAAARACLRAAMDRRHRLVGREEDLTYLHTEAASAAAASCAHRVFSLVQFFPLHETSAGVDFGLAGAFECRVSCVLCDRVRHDALVSAVLGDVVEAVRERNRATARRDRHLFVLTSHSGENEQGLQLVQASLGTRRMRLLASFMEGALAPAPAVERGAAAAAAAVGRPGTPPTPERCYRYPLMSFPWSLLEALCFRWVLGCGDHYPYVAEEVLSHLVSRRLHSGFTLLVHYTSSLRAVLVRRVGDPATQSDVCLYDVLEALPSTAPAPASQMCIRRIVTPCSRVRATLWAYTRDLAEDLHIATAVFTCKVIATPQQQPGERRLVARQMRERGFSPVVARVESILFALQARYTEYVELRSPPSLGVDGCARLRDRIVNLVSCVGDRSAVVKAHMLQADYVQRLSSGGDAVDPDADVCISVLSPMRFKTILCVLVLECDSNAGAARHVVKVALAALDAHLLEYAITQKYQHRRATPLSAEEETSAATGAAAPSRAAMPECVADRAVVLSLRHLLTVFSAVYGARELMAFMRRASAEAAAAAVAELTDAYAHLGNYAVEVDATHLLRVVQWRCATTDAAPWKSRVQEVLTDVMASQQLSFPTHPTLWLPELKADRARRRWQRRLRKPTADGVGHSPSANTGDDDNGHRGCGSDTDTEEEEDGEEEDGEEKDGEEGGVACEDGTRRGSGSGLDQLPVVVKACALFQSSAGGGGGEAGAECRWLSSALADGGLPRRSALRDRAAWAVPSAASALAAADATAMQLKVRLFVKTVPVDLLELCEEASFHPPQTVVRRTLRLLYYRFTAEEAPAAAVGPPATTAAVATSHQGVSDEAAAAAEMDALFTQPTAVVWDRQRCHTAFHSCADRSSLPDRVERAMQRIAERLQWRAAAYCLHSACCSRPFHELRTRVLAEPVRDAVLSHSVGMRSVPLTESAELRALLCDVVAPALLSSRRFLRATFALTFTQQETNAGRVVPDGAVAEVFHRCVDEDEMWVLRTPPSLSFVVVPNSRYLAERWVLVSATTTPSHAVGEARILVYDAHSTPASLEAVRSYVSHLSTHLCNKITQVSQLHLLKQLRESLNASAELIPPNWGDQFSGGGGGGAPPQAQGGRAAESLFHLRGRNVLEIPIYYKLQHQCRKILQRIQGHYSRLELVAIFNRDQCFLAADDVDGDTFHYLRLVFVRDTAHTVSVTSRPPPLTSSERCPQLVVQLFSATPNASVRRPLQRLQDFCYLLAVQELQGHLNYVQHKMISFNDLVFLQNQRLEPIVVDLRTVLDTAAVDDASSQARDTRQREMALALLFLNLREFKFKPFGVQDEPTHATSNFVEHYNLEKSLRLEPAKDATASTRGGGGGGGDGSGGSSSGGAVRAWRFVKIVDGMTDVLVSCSLHVHPDDAQVIVIDRYLTRIPAERYINGDSESTILAHLTHCVEETRAQLRFFALTSPGLRGSPLMRSSLRATVGDLLRVSQEASSKESSLLRRQHFSLDRVNPAVLPMLVDRVCGALAHYAPRCFTYAASRALKGVVPVPGFSWTWMEAVQNDAAADQLEMYVLCGYDVMDSAEASSPLPPTRVVPYVVPGVPITCITTGESQMSLLGEYQLCEHGCPLLEYRIVLSLSLVDGLSLAIFNLRDTDYVVRLLGYVVQEMEEKSELLEDVLLQRMGYTVPSSYNEADLARNCCGDDTNVIRAKPLSISSDVYRRRVNNVRFRPHPDAERDEPLVVVLEGLYNRGLIVNYVFPAEDAIKVLFDECPQYSLQECVRLVDALLEAGVLCDEPQSALKAQMPILASLPHSEQLRSDARNCRLCEVTGVPADALIACGYHRHILASHIIVEAQNARSGVAEVLARCDALWRAGPRNNVLELAKAIVTLQLKSKQVFGARVPDFSLRRERWRNEDDVLDPTLPTQTQQTVTYARPVDASLHLYTEHLRQLYPSMCVIDLDPNDPHTTSNEVLLNRLRCRYGKATNDSGEVVLFSPHLYYAVIPVVDLLRSRGFQQRYGRLVEALGEEATASPITSSGLFIVEIGFQVVHYALDFFVINGDAVPPGITATVAADFKQALLFDGVLYDAAVRSLAQCLRVQSVVLSGQQTTYEAVANLVKYHPFPPLHCSNVVAAYTITDPRVMRLKSLTPGGAVNNGDLHVGVDGVLYLSPQKHNLLQREQTNEMYTYGGLIIWERAQLFVLLTNTRDVGKAARESNSDLSRLVLSAKQLLLSQLLDSTQQERLDVAWRKFLSDGRAAPTATGRGGAERELPSYDELELLRSYSHRVVLHSYVPVLQMILEPVDWGGDAWRLRAACAQLYPDHVLHVIWRQRGTREAQDTPASAAHARLYDLHPSAPPVVAAAGAAGPIGGYDITRLFVSPCSTGWFAVTLAPGKAEEGGWFLAMECCSNPHRPFGASIVVDELSFYCKPSRDAHQHRVMTVLGEAEQSLVERFVRLVNYAVWSSIVPCTSQFMA